MRMVARDILHRGLLLLAEILVAIINAVLPPHSLAVDGLMSDFSTG
jgi:hypothetical protein